MAKDNNVTTLKYRTTHAPEIKLSTAQTEAQTIKKAFSLQEIRKILQYNRSQNVYISSLNSLGTLIKYIDARIDKQNFFSDILDSFAFNKKAKDICTAKKYLERRSYFPTDKMSWCAWLANGCEGIEMQEEDRINLKQSIYQHFLEDPYMQELQNSNSFKYATIKAQFNPEPSELELHKKGLDKLEFLSPGGLG